MYDRRAILAGLGAAAFAGGADAATKEPVAPAPEAPLFTSEPLRSNPLASAFTIPAKPLKWPSCRLMAPGGKSTSIEAWRGKLLMVVLWAEWCTPCLTELPALAYHARKSNNDKFEILPIITGSHVFERPVDANPLLEQIGAKGLLTLMDGSPEGDRLITLGKDPRHPNVRGAIPCSLILGPDGQIRAHVLGAKYVDASDAKGINVWATNKGQEFVSALATGQLPA